ncbi:hypothetical protein [Paeniglutamicibacter quisquiliarum]|nr:hypothetical protein [Paeniglutamicibacter quisquiliarum]
MRTAATGNAFHTSTGSLGWAIASGLLGLVLVPGLLQTVTLISGQ